MNCAVYRSLASDRLDLPLGRDEERALDAHLALCRECTRAEKGYALLRGLLRERAEVVPPPALERSIFSRIEADRDALAGRIVRSLLSLLPRPGLVPSTVLAATLLAALAAVGGSGDEPRRPQAIPTREASLLTVWDTSAETIVATYDPSGLAAHASAAWREPSGRPGPERTPVRMFLFERIRVGD